MYGSRYMGYNYSPLSSLDETMKKSSGVATNSIKQARTDTLSNLNTSSSSAISASSSSIPSSQSSQRIKNNSQATSTSSSTPHALLTFKNNLFGELTRAIQLVQKTYLDKDPNSQPLTNSDYQVHELCQQFDYVFLFGLKHPDEAYWKVVLEFTHRDVIQELNKLLNVTTNFGKGRAWLYHALNDNLMESYLRCFIDNKKSVSRYYKKDASLLGDDQAIGILVTLVAGLENVQFKLQNDVPYLDHSCWPTHLNIKRRVVDAILNSSPPILSQFIDLNNSFEPGTKNFNINQQNKLDHAQLVTNMLSSSVPGSNNSLLQNNQIQQQRVKKPTNRLRKTANSNSKAKLPSNRSQNQFLNAHTQANNISFENTNSTTSSTYNLSDLNGFSNDIYVNGDESASETSGRFTGASNTLNNEGSSPNSLIYKQKEMQFKKTQQQNMGDTTDEMFDDNDYNGDEDLDSNYDPTPLPPSSLKETPSLLLKSSTPPVSMTIITCNQRDVEDEIENEIDKLRIENKLTNKTKNILIKTNSSDDQSANGDGLSTSVSSSFKIKRQHKNNISNFKDETLLASSLKASNNFDKKLHDIENYSQIIENATLNMDACVKDMNIVYENFDNRLSCESNSLSNEDLNSRLVNKNENLKSDIVGTEQSTCFSVYDLEHKKDEENTIKKTSSSPSLISLNNIKSSSRNSLASINAQSQQNINTADETIYYLDVDVNENEELKQEYKIDNNTKLMLMIDIFQNGQNEELVKMFHVTRGHSQGEIESLTLLISSYGVYFLTRKENSDDTNDDNGSIKSGSGIGNGVPQLNSNGSSKNKSKFIKESFINFNQLDYIEVSLCDQAIHFMCINKRQNCWVTTASRILTKRILESIEMGRAQNKSLKFPKLSVFHEAMQQKLAINKFIAKEENLDPHDIEIKNYSLVYWEDQTSAVSHIIHKEGYLFYFSKTSGSSTEWKKAYYILKNDVLTQYKSHNDKRPSQVIKLNGEDFSGCRKNTKSSKPHTIELILSDSNILYLAAKSETEASDWLQCFCKIISLGNLHTDVPTNTCLPCCSITTNNKLYFCHEDLNTGFYRLLETIKMQEINRISFDNENPFYCILHDDSDPKKNRYWFVYFIDERERNEFITCFKNSWDVIFEISLTVEKCKSTEMRKRCIRGVRLIHKLWDWDEFN